MRSGGRSYAGSTLHRIFHDFQILRLKLERIISRLLHPSRFRLLAVACWDFPIDSQAFVYGQLGELNKNGFQIRFVYSKLNPRAQLLPEFDFLWSAKRKLDLYSANCELDYQYFLRKMPERVKALIEIVCNGSGMREENLRAHPHFYQAFAFARLADAYRPDYLHSYFFYEGTLFSLFASFLLDIPRGVSCYSDHMLKDYDLKIVPTHLNQCSLIVVPADKTKKELKAIAPETDLRRFFVNSSNYASLHHRLFDLLTKQESAAPDEASPLVSIITVFYNAEKFIREAIESVVAQTYKDWEYLMIDDGSSDGSTRIAREYARRFQDKIFYLEHPGHENHGASAARNLGIRQAKGKFIAFLDADDVWYPKKLQEQIAILQQNPEAAMLYGSSVYWQSWDTKDADAQDFIPDHGIPSDRLYEPPSLSLLNYPFGPGTPPCPSDMVVRRDAALAVGGFEKEFRGKYQLYEDQVFLTKIYLRYAVFVSGECWDRYRIHPDSCIAVVKSAGQYHSVRLYFLNWCEKYLESLGQQGTPVWESLQAALSNYRLNDEKRILNVSAKN